MFLKVLMNNILPIKIIKSVNLGNISLHFAKKKKKTPPKKNRKQIKRNMG